MAFNPHNLKLLIQQFENLAQSLKNFTDNDLDFLEFDGTGVNTTGIPCVHWYYTLARK